MIQAATLSGEDWLGSSACSAHPAVLAGDFNAVPLSRAYGILAEGLSRPALTTPARPTFPARFPVLRLDHVFTNRRARIIRYEVIDTPLARSASDHLPLLAIVECLPQLAAVQKPSGNSKQFQELAAHG